MPQHEVSSLILNTLSETLPRAVSRSWEKTSHHLLPFQGSSGLPSRQQEAEAVEGAAGRPRASLPAVRGGRGAPQIVVPLASRLGS